MREIKISKNEAGQRLDRYLRKLLGQASLSFIYKQIRKKNITVNNSKTNEKYMLAEGDLIKIFFSEETFENLKSRKKKVLSRLKLDVVYEDENLLVVNKPAGLLSHSTKGNYKEDNLVDAIIAYLINKGDFIPERGSTFTPAIANRLDRNTSGLIIVGKNYRTLQELNKIQKLSGIEKFYKTVVVGRVVGEKVERAAFEKLENKENQVKIFNSSNEDYKEVITAYKSLKSSKKYSLLEVNLITGRTHQIRAHLAFLKMPVVGDRKYGLASVNKYFQEKYDLNNQLLHCYKMIFSKFEGKLEYLNGMSFEVEDTKILKNIIRGEIDGN